MRPQLIAAVALTALAPALSSSAADVVPTRIRRRVSTATKQKVKLCLTGIPAGCAKRDGRGMA
ncbi:MAG: hypothetical protein P4M09_12765 [Devosia sp.]|nr:hypothetical protein [Devosia sp.]